MPQLFNLVYNLVFLCVRVCPKAHAHVRNTGLKLKLACQSGHLWAEGWFAFTSISLALTGSKSCVCHAFTSNPSIRIWIRSKAWNRVFSCHFNLSESGYSSWISDDIFIIRLSPIITHIVLLSIYTYFLYSVITHPLTKSSQPLQTIHFAQPLPWQPFNWIPGLL